MNDITKTKIYPNVVSDKTDVNIDLHIGGTFTGCTVISEEPYAKKNKKEF